MIIIVLTDCPPKLRGDLSKWLFEINTGVYVGNLSSRVRDLLWDRICDNVQHGQATMVYSASGEQKMSFRVHNTKWEIVDYDGIKLMRRPGNRKQYEERKGEKEQKRYGKAWQYEKGRRMQIAKQKAELGMYGYVVIDIETTGLSYRTDEIIEIAALKITEDKKIEEFQALIQSEKSIPTEVTELTGITDEDIRTHGEESLSALSNFKNFIEDYILVCHNAAFDFRFLQIAFNKADMKMPRNKCVDTLSLSRRKLKGLSDYKLQTVAKYFSLDTTGSHRALRDCYITNEIYVKLNEM